LRRAVVSTLARRFVVEREHRDDGFTAIEDQYAGYTVYDKDYDKIGKVDDLFVDETDQPEYIGVKMGFLGLRSTLIPWAMARVNEQRQIIEVSADKETAKNAPTFDDDEEITPELEERVYSHFGLQRTGGLTDRGGYGAYYGHEDCTGRSAATAGVTGVNRHSGERRGAEILDEGRIGAQHKERERTGEAGPGMTMGDRESGGEFRPHGPGQEGPGEPESDLEDTDELRVQRTEEELQAGTREREAGSVNVRKRVRTEREQVRVPKRREEVSVERVPVEGREAPEAEIGEDEVEMPVTEEEVVTEERPMVKEEIRVRKDAVQDEEVVEEDVRKEEVDVDDATGRGGALGRNADGEVRRRDR
jgi:uncharacterized protein (TIGR02271 family)